MANDNITEIAKITNTGVWLKVAYALPANDEPVLLRLKKSNEKLEHIVASYRNGNWQFWDGFTYQTVHTNNRVPFEWISIPVQVSYWSEGTRM